MEKSESVAVGLATVKDLDPAEFARRRAAHLVDKVNDIHEHMRRCFEHIVKGRRQQIVLFFDNLDQRPEDFQQRAFLLGQSVAELWPATVFLTLRPETYHRSRAAGTLSAYHQRAVGNQQKWHTLVPERSEVGWRSRELPEGLVVLSSPFYCLSLHLPSPAQDLFSPPP